MKKQTLPDLPYAYDALEPVISGEIMELHHSKHHNTYVNNYNALVEKATDDVAGDIALQSAIKFNGGGHVNHSIFWTNLAPISEGGGTPPTGELLEAIKKEFGSLEQFIAQFSAKTAAVQGSGWGWLGYDAGKKRLAIETCANQDPLSTKGLVPLLGVDVWEHAYYLQYKNVRPDYLKAIWQVINWSNVAERYKTAIA
jgi:superoxide dismutase, Fe-Mn family